MQRSLPLIENKTDLKLKSWMYTNNKGVKTQNNFLILQRDENETSKYYLFCIYCVCFGSSSRSRLSSNGIIIEEAVYIRRTISEHVDSSAHQKCEKEYLSDVPMLGELSPSEYEGIENNRFIVNEVLETLVHIISSS